MNGEVRNSHPIETKVKAASAAAALASLVTSLLVLQVPDLKALDESIKAVLIMAFTSAFTWLAGFSARHTFRPGEAPPPPPDEPLV